MAGEEKQLQNQILDFLARLPIVDIAYPHHQVKARIKHTRSKHEPNGISDITGAMSNGVALFIEVKTPKGKLSAAQSEFLSDRRKANCVAFVARSVDDVIRELAEFGY